jgi:Protein of unknown function VcgC/VcgE (DUF2780)
MKKQNILFSVFLIALAAIYLAGCSSSKTVTDTMTKTGLTSQLSKELGMTSSQTEAGLGAMMMLSKSKLSPEDFTKLSGAIPGGTSGLIDKATSLGVGSISSATDIVSSLGKLGVSPATAAKFIPEVLSLSKNLGGGAFGLLSKVF